MDRRDFTKTFIFVTILYSVIYYLSSHAVNEQGKITLPYICFIAWMATILICARIHFIK